MPLQARIRKRPSYEPHIWGPHFWFFLHTIAMTYPDNANAVTKRKYYDLITNMPLFLPNSEIGDKFARLLDKYPVSPYLGKRESFIRWTVFIHNKVNIMLGKPEMELEDAVGAYNRAYVPDKLELYGGTDIKKNVVAIGAGILLALVLIAYIVY
jgi:hypothetical protein